MGTHSALRLSPIERAMGRPMRAPDGHDGGGDGGASGGSGGGSESAASGDAGAGGSAAEGGGDGASGSAGGDGGAGNGSQGSDPLGGGTILGGADDGKSGEGGDEGGKEGEGGESAAPAGAPEKYELKAGEGQTLDADAVAAAEPVFRELNLSNDQAQKLTDLYASEMARVGEAAIARQVAEVAAVRADWAKQSEADDEVGGARFEESKALAAKAMDGLELTADFRTFLNDSGLGNHPEMLRMLRRVGSAIGEDGFSRGTSASAKPTTAQTLYPNDAPKGA